MKAKEKSPAQTFLLVLCWDDELIKPNFWDNEDSLAGDDESNITCNVRKLWSCCYFHWQPQADTEGGRNKGKLFR